MKQTYDIIYSLGRDCACAMYMKAAGLRSFAGPFDWLTGADFGERMRLLLDDFDGFLDQQSFRPMEKPNGFPPDAHNDYYENTKTGLYFWHDFTAGEPFDLIFPRIKEKYERRIDRFYSTIKARERVLLIGFSHQSGMDVCKLSVQCDAFSQKMGKSIDFLFIEHAEGVERAVVEDVNEHLRIIRCHTMQFDVTGALTTLGCEKRVFPLFRQYRLYKPLSVRCIERGIRLLCCVLPVKKWRKALRKKYLCK